MCITFGVGVTERYVAQFPSLIGINGIAPHFCITIRVSAVVFLHIMEFTDMRSIDIPHLTCTPTGSCVGSASVGCRSISAHAVYARYSRFGTSCIHWLAHLEGLTLLEVMVMGAYSPAVWMFEWMWG